MYMYVQYVCVRVRCVCSVYVCLCLCVYVCVWTHNLLALAHHIATFTKFKAIPVALVTNSSNII